MIVMIVMAMMVIMFFSSMIKDDEWHEGAQVCIYDDLVINNDYHVSKVAFDNVDVLKVVIMKIMSFILWTTYH